MNKFMMLVVLVLMVLASAVGLRNLTAKTSAASMSAPVMLVAGTGMPMPKTSGSLMGTGMPMPRSSSTKTTN